MPPSKGNSPRLVGLITVLLVVVAIMIVLALNSKPQQTQWKIKTVSGQSFGRETKHITPEVTTSTTPVLVEVQKISNALSKLFPTTTTTLPSPVATEHRITLVAPSAVPVVTGQCESIVQHFFPEVLLRALQIARRESQCSMVTNTHEACDGNGSHAIGPFQLCMPLHQDLFIGVCAGKWYDMYCSIQAARRLYDAEGGWSPAWN